MIFFSSILFNDFNHPSEISKRMENVAENRFIWNNLTQKKCLEEKKVEEKKNF